jgi:hypothetical protein
MKMEGKEPIQTGKMHPQIDQCRQAIPNCWEINSRKIILGQMALSIEKGNFGSPFFDRYFNWTKSVKHI